MLWADRGRLAAIAAALAFLCFPPPNPAQVEPTLQVDSKLLEQNLILHGKDVWFGPTPDNPGGTRRYLYSPLIGAYTLGPDKNFAGLNPLDAFMRQSVILPKGDPTFQGNPIPATSGAILPIDINRAIVDEGMHDAAPWAFRHPDVPVPWHWIPDGQMCASAFENAWTFSAGVIAPEVEAFRVRLTNQKATTDSILIGAVKPNFPVAVVSALGTVCLRDGAKALVSRSMHSLRVLSLTGRKNSVLVKFPSGRTLAIGPGSELVASRSRDLLAAHPNDGILRRGMSPIFSTGDMFVAVNEFSGASVLKATGLAQALTRDGSSSEKRFCNSVMKTAAALAIMRGSGGFRPGADETGSFLARKQ